MKTSKSAIFLFELMIIILVFTLAAAICTQIFASSFKMSTESRDLTMASMNAQTLAEQYKAGKTNIEPLYFDRDWANTSEQGACYTVSIDDTKSTPHMKDATVDVMKKGEAAAIYTIHVKEFVN